MRSPNLAAQASLDAAKGDLVEAEIRIWITRS